MNISSIVVRTSPDHVEEVVESLRRSGVCDVHFHDQQGRVVVTIEGGSLDDELGKMKAIQAVSHVWSAKLSYAYSEQDLASAMEHLERAAAVPDVLEQEDLDAQSLSYGGRPKI